MQEKAWERETAAFTGFCAGAAFALAWNGKLGTFSEFYSTDKAEPKKRDHVSGIYRQIQLLELIIFD